MRMRMSIPVYGDDATHVSDIEFEYGTLLVGLCASNSRRRSPSCIHDIPSVDMYAMDGTLLSS